MSNPLPALLCAILLSAASAARAQDAPLSRDMVRDVEAVVDAAGGRWALVVGIEQYDDPNINDLRYADDDARAIAESLIAGGAFTTDHVVLMTSDAVNPALRPTRTNILLQIGKLEEVAEAELVVAFFSGHGLGASDGSARQNYIVAMDSNIKIPHETAVSVERIVSGLGGLSARRRYIIFDACRNQLRNDTKGALPEAFTDRSYTLSEGTQVLYCTKFGDVSYEDPERGHGACTGLLLDGLEGQADGVTGQPSDAVVSTRELNLWLERRLPALSVGPTPQTPFLMGEISGDFALAAARLPPPPDVVPKPDVALFNATLAPGLAYTLDRHRQQERSAFLAARSQLSAALPALTEPITIENAADFHRMQLVHRATVQDVEGALGALRSVAALSPGRSPLEGLDPLPPLLANVQLEDQGDPLGERERLPRGVSLLVDGQRAKARPLERPAVVQALSCGSAREIQWTRYLGPDAELPASYTPDLSLCRAPLERGLALGSGLGFAASGAALAGALIERARFNATLDGTNAEDLARDPDLVTTAETHERNANRLFYAAQGLAVAGVGLGVGWITVKF